MDTYRRWLVTAPVPSCDLRVGDVLVHDPAATVPYTVTRSLPITAVCHALLVASGALDELPALAPSSASPPRPRLWLHRTGAPDVPD